MPESKHVLRQCWRNMRRRCGLTEAKRERNWRWYVDLGVTVCEEWSSFEVFYAWAIQAGWQPCLFIDRKDNTKGYGPSNCRWITPSESSRNRRPRFSIYAGTPKGAHAGAEHHMAVLTEDQAKAIISDKRRVSQIAAEYEVSLGCVCDIKSGRRWKHLHQGGQDALAA